MTRLIALLLFIATPLSSAASVELLVSWAYRSPDCVERHTAIINGEFPGPTIRVKPGERVVVKVTNGLITDSLSIHWHGQRQYKNVWHDGIGMISSCPIAPHQSFTYIFNANEEPGTYFYHAHLGGMRSAGIYGVLIIDWDTSLPWSFDQEEILLLNDWYHAPTDELIAGLLEGKFRWSGDPQSVLINGKGYYNCTGNGIPTGTNYPYYKPSGTVYCDSVQCPGLETVTVKKGSTVLLRLVCASELSFMNIAIQGHTMTLVEADGQPMEQLTVSSLDINSGQRYSVLVTADQPVDAYWINVKTRHRSGVVQGQAVLRYEGAGSTPAQDVASVAATQPAWDNSTFTFTQQHSLRGRTPAPSNNEVSRRIVLLGTQERFDWSTGSQSHPVSNPPENMCNDTGRHLRWAVNRVSYKFESTPVAHMVYYKIRPETITQERGFIKIKSGDVIDLVIQNYPACNRVCEQHPWHLHGHKFWVVGMGQGTWTGSKEQVDSLNTFTPVLRDTTTVIPDSPTPFGGQVTQGGCGWTVVRFVADNPGVWPFHCHITWHFIMGMQVIFIESPEDFPKPGPDVTICGDVTPEVYLAARTSGGSVLITHNGLLVLGWAWFYVRFLSLY